MGIELGSARGLVRVRIAAVSPAIRSYGIAVGGAVSAQIMTAFVGLLTARWLGADGKGHLVAVLAWRQQIGWLLGFGLGAAFSRKIASSPTEHRVAIAALGRGLSWATVMSLVGVPLSIAFMPDALPYVPTEIVLLGAGTIPLILVNGTAAGVILGMGHRAKFGIGTLASPVGTLVVLFVARGVGELTPALALSAYIGGEVLSGAVLMPWTILKSPRWHEIVDVPSWKFDLTFASRYHLGELFSQISARADVLLLGLIVPSAELARYSVANSWLMPLAALPGIVATLALPRAAAARSPAQRQAHMLDVRRWSAQIFMGGLVLGVLAVLLAEVAIVSWLGPSYDRQTTTFMWILFVGVAARGSATILTRALSGAGWVREGLRVQSLGAAVTIVGLGFLVPRWGAIGAAWASLGAYGLTYLAARKTVRHVSKIG